MVVGVGGSSGKLEELGGGGQVEVAGGVGVGEKSHY